MSGAMDLNGRDGDWKRLILRQLGRCEQDVTKGKEEEELAHGKILE